MTALVPRMTTKQPPDAQPTAAEHTISVHGLAGIFRTGRVKTTARPKQWADQVLISPNYQNEQTGHFPSECLSRGLGTSRESLLQRGKLSEQVALDLPICSPKEFLAYLYHYIETSDLVLMKPNLLTQNAFHVISSHCSRCDLFSDNYGQSRKSEPVRLKKYPQKFAVFLVLKCKNG